MFSNLKTNSHTSQNVHQVRNCSVIQKKVDEFHFHAFQNKYLLKYGELQNLFPKFLKYFSVQENVHNFEKYLEFVKNVVDFKKCSRI